MCPPGSPAPSWTHELWPIHSCAGGGGFGFGCGQRCPAAADSECADLSSDGRGLGGAGRPLWMARAAAKCRGGVVFGGVFLLFYLVHAMGAGDVKLAAALGCIVGLPQAVSVMIDTAFAGGILAILLMLASRRTMQTIRNTLSVVGFHARHGLQAHPVVNLDNPDSARMPYGLAFAAGTLYWALFLQLWR